MHVCGTDSLTRTRAIRSVPNVRYRTPHNPDDVPGVPAPKPRSAHAGMVPKPPPPRASLPSKTPDQFEDPQTVAVAPRLDNIRQRASELRRQSAGKGGNPAGKTGSAASVSAASSDGDGRAQRKPHPPPVG